MDQSSRFDAPDIVGDSVLMIFHPTLLRPRRPHGNTDTYLPLNPLSLLNGKPDPISAIMRYLYHHQCAAPNFWLSGSQYSRFWDDMDTTNMNLPFPEAYIQRCTKRYYPIFRGACATIEPQLLRTIPPTYTRCRDGFYAVLRMEYTHY